MCGIFCYYSGDGICYSKILHIILTGLKTLEYRGYDSAGLFIKGSSDEDGVMYKSVGNVDELAKKINQNLDRDCTFNLAIGHTRWATHGSPCEKNTHPHVSPENTFVVVHNGIITNYIYLKMYLHDAGFYCVSDTDTEVIPLLYYKFSLEYTTDSFCALTNRVISLLQGAYAFCVISKQYPDEMIIVRKESPIIIGKSDDGYIISSDVNGIVAFGNSNAIFLKNNDIAHIQGNELQIWNGNNLIDRSFEHIDATYQDISKGSYKYFMEKEIYEQPLTVSMTFKHRLINTKNVLIPELVPHLLKFHNAHRILLVACGSSLHSCLTVRNYYEKIFNHKIIQIENACNLIDRNEFYVSGRDIIIFLSQSGETSDTLLSLRQIKKRCPTVFTCAITNMQHSSLARECDIVIYNNIGNEIGVASTKSYTSQILLLVLIALQFCKDEQYVHTVIQEIQQLPSLLSIGLSTIIPDVIIQTMLSCNNILVIGRNEHYATALETALKLKEISYIHCEGLLADELKHGPLAMIDDSVVVFVISSNDLRMHSTIQQLRTRNARMVILTHDDQLFDLENCIKINNSLKTSVLRTIVDIVPCQLLAYKIALEKNINVDQPRHLAKSVTVSD